MNENEKKVEMLLRRPGFGGEWFVVSGLLRVEGATKTFTVSNPLGEEVKLGGAVLVRDGHRKPPCATATQGGAPGEEIVLAWSD